MVMASTYMLLTGTSSFEEAGQVCQARHLQRADYRKHIHNHDELRPLPTVYFLIASALVSWVSMVAWLFASPHKIGASSTARSLDRKLGSYTFARLLANMCQLVIECRRCTSSPLVLEVGSFLGITIFFGIGIIGSNLLLHRYLLEKACAVSASVFDPVVKAAAAAELRKLRGAFILEVRVLVLLPLGQVFFVLGVRSAFLWVAGIGVAVLMLTDASFSLKVTAVFLRPILRVMVEGGGDHDVRTSTNKRLALTKYQTLFGTSIAVSFLPSFRPSFLPAMPSFLPPFFPFFFPSSLPLNTFLQIPSVKFLPSNTFRQVPSFKYLPSMPSFLPSPFLPSSFLPSILSKQYLPSHISSFKYLPSFLPSFVFLPSSILPCNPPFLLFLPPFFLPCSPSSFLPSFLPSFLTNPSL
jgi:hypothetical protein